MAASPCVKALMSSGDTIPLPVHTGLAVHAFDASVLMHVGFASSQYQGRGVQSALCG